LNNTTTKIVAFIVLALCAALCCICLAYGGASLLLYRVISNVKVEPYLPTVQASPTPGPSFSTAPVEPGAKQMLKVLESSVPPVNDPYDLAQRLQNQEQVPLTLQSPTKPLATGDEKQFWISNADTHESRQADAVLRYSGQHLYFWVEKGVAYIETDIQNLVDAFDTKIYPTDRAYFGSEWSPGIDNDLRLNLLYVKGLGKSLAGYFSASDELNPIVDKHSNACEMFMVNADTVDLGGKYIYSTMAHEFQHMIHWNIDRGEETWLNEGFSVLAEFLNGYFSPDFDRLYAMDTDMQLTDWSNVSGQNGPHYGASFLFMDYFFNRFGEKVTRDLLNNPRHGMDSIEAVLAEEEITDPLTNQPIHVENVFADWAAANLLQDPSVSDGRFAYTNYAKAPQAAVTEVVRDCPSGDQMRTVHQFGVDAIRIACPGQWTLNFQGSNQVNLLSAGAHSGSFAFWSNQTDSSDMTLTHSFDFSHTSAPISLSYAAWYDLEKDFDFTYLEASEDGKTWKIIPAPSCSAIDTAGSSYGCGYNGSSSGWIEETVDLSQFAGKKIQLRFEYVTDACVSGQGFLLDDVSIPAINYSTDFEKDDGGWQAAGFIRLENHLPQTYRISLILRGSQNSVQTIVLDANQQASIHLDLSGDVQDAILVVSGVTRFTRQEAAYQFNVSP
jgi:immune inhibitor A